MRRKWTLSRKQTDKLLTMMIWNFIFLCYMSPTPPSFLDTYRYNRGYLVRTNFTFSPYPYFHRDFSIGREKYNKIRSVNSFTDIDPKLYKDYSSKFVSNLLHTFNDPANTLINNEKSQRRIESIIIDEFDASFSSNKSKYIAGVNTELLASHIFKYVLNISKDVRGYIDTLLDSENHYLVRRHDKKLNMLRII